MGNREEEKVKREQAQAHKGTVVPGSGQSIEPGSLEQMVSVRLDSLTVAQLRNLADERKVSLSSLIRDAAREFAARAKYTSRISWQVTRSDGTVVVETQEWREKPTSRSALRDVGEGAVAV